MGEPGGKHCSVKVQPSRFLAYGRFSLSNRRIVIGIQIALNPPANQDKQAASRCLFPLIL